MSTISANVTPIGTLRNRMRVLALSALAMAVVAALAAIPSSAGAATSRVARASRAASITCLPPSQVEAILAKTPLTALPVPELAEVLSKLKGLGSIEPAKLQEALTKTIETLKEKSGTLGGVLNPSESVSTLKTELEKILGWSELLKLLGGSPTTTLTEALKSTNATEVLGKVLSSAAKPEALIGQVLGAANPEKFKELVGSTLTGEPFSTATVSELSNKLGTTPGGLAKSVNMTISQLPEGAMTLTGPLTNGKALGVLNSLGGPAVTVIEGATKPGSGEGGKGGNGGSGSGGSGSDGSGAAGTTTVLVNLTQAQAASGGVVSGAVGKIKVLGHSVAGRTATIVVGVPSAGNLTASGNGVKSVSRETAKAERVTVKLALTKAGAASVHRHRHLAVTVHIAFKQAAGPRSSTAVRVVFH